MGSSSSSSKASEAASPAPLAGSPSAHCLLPLSLPPAAQPSAAQVDAAQSDLDKLLLGKRGGVLTAALADAVMSISAAHSLDLHGRGISADADPALCMALRAMSHLKKLVLRDNDAKGLDETLAILARFMSVTACRSWICTTLCASAMRQQCSYLRTR